MSRDELMHLFDLLSTPAEIADYHRASGLIIETRVPSADFVQLIGPYPKDTVEALEVMERLRSEVTEGPPVTFTVRLLFPPSYAEVPQ